MACSSASRSLWCNGDAVDIDVGVRSGTKSKHLSSFSLQGGARQKQIAIASSYTNSISGIGCVGVTSRKAFSGFRPKSLGSSRSLTELQCRLNFCRLRTRGLRLVLASSAGNNSLITSSKQVSPGKNDAPPTTVVVDNESHEKFSVINVETPNRVGILQLLTSTMKDLGLVMIDAKVDLAGGLLKEIFYVTDTQGRKVTDEVDMRNIETVLKAALSEIAFEQAWKFPRRTSVVGKGPATQDTDGDLYNRSRLLYRLMDQYLQNDVFSIQKSIMDHVEYTIARSRFKFDDFEAYMASAYSVRDRLIESWNDTQHFFRQLDTKRVYYLSMEFLMGRSLLNSVFNLGIKDQYAEALRQLGYNLEVLVEQERDAALGNGGLGRLAACFLDSLATMNYSAWGYGIRYQYGMFRQTLQDGYQHEQPDYWLNFGNPWEIERVHVTYPIRFYGKVEEHWNGKKHFEWIPSEQVAAVAYDNPIPGYGTKNTINLRLWAAKPSGEFDLQSFNTGDYVNAILSKQRAEAISSVLYPDDRTYQGKELRLKQQYFFVSASLQDVIRRFKDHHDSFDEFPNKVALQLNDAHPSIGIPELLRILIDEEGLEYYKAWDICTRVFSFTNHTVNPEALEKWPIELMESLLPRHLQIITEINVNFLEELRRKYGNDYERLSRMSIIEDGEKKIIRMGALALVASHTVNGVAEIHTSHIKNMFRDFYELWPHKFQNKTNGVTQRRWLALCNPGLQDVLTKYLGTDAWITNLDLLAGIRKHARNPELHKEWNLARRQNKARLAAYIEGISGVKVSIDAMFDVQVKRIHEYKRQLLNVMSIIHRYDCIKNMTPEERKNVVPRVCILGGKAAPGYEVAKKIIKLVAVVGEKINNDPDVGNLLKVIFVPDYNVSVAELIIPASDVSQHISTAGNEASGTSNMKFAMNGCIILGTYDGANVEIQQEIGKENIFLFGAKAEQVPKLRAERRDFQPPRLFTRIIGMLRNGVFGHQEHMHVLCDTLEGQGGDFYLLGNDFQEYLEAQAAVDAAFVDRPRWTQMSIMSTAGSGKFSSDRTIKEYAEQIWDIKPFKRPV
ncbi:hypothetical protein R1flu_000353 [Riccia fluitans]|uniref:Alpha-1,4 glucan phosphorylase n=1 Tax=Riccia fluitans TaxID=41844 RepID=A0ABD1Y0E9_9MARC